MNKLIITVLFTIFLYLLPDSFSIYAQETVEINFEDVTKISRISYNGESYGSSWGDVNDDGWPDLFTGNHGFIGNGPQLFLNNKDGTFKEVTLHQNIYKLSQMDLHTASWVDFDNDGDKDLFIMVGGQKGVGMGSNVLMINTNGILQYTPGALGLDYPYGRGRAPVWVDWNNDGLLDVILINLPRPDKKSPTALFINNGTRFEIFETFDDIGMGYISNLLSDEKLKLIFLTTPMQSLYSLNEVPIRNEINKVNLKKDWANDIVIADFNGDISLDVYRTTGGLLNPLRNDIFEINVNENSFEEKNKDEELTNTIPCKGSVAGDFDNDMDLDLYLACSNSGTRVGTTTKYNNNLPNILYENQGNGVFKKIDKARGAEGTNLSSGDSVTIVDYDNDGFLDLFVTNGEYAMQNTGGPHQLFRNLGNDNNWLEIDLKGIDSNADGVGSKIVVTTDGRTQLREQNGGMHFRTQDYQRIHFGLGNHTNIQSILVYWPNGMISGIKDVSSNQLLEIVEPEFPPSPYQQMDLGVKIKEIICKKNLEKMIKLSNNKVTCVTSFSMKKLLERNWGTSFPK